MEQTQLLDKNGNPIEEPSFYERLYFVERFYRRHRKLIIGILAVPVIGSLIYGSNSLLTEHKLNVVNEAYYKYANNIEPEENLKIIESKNQKLYSLIKFSEALKNGEKIDAGNFEHRVLKDIAEFQKLSEARDTAGLNSYSYKDGAIYRDLAIILEAYVLIESGKVDEAKNRLAFIEDTSSLKELANYLNHFGVVSNKNLAQNQTENKNVSNGNNGQSTTDFMDAKSIKNLNINQAININNDSSNK